MNWASNAARRVAYCDNRVTRSDEEGEPIDEGSVAELVRVSAPTLSALTCCTPLGDTTNSGDDALPPTDTTLHDDIPNTTNNTSDNIVDVVFMPPIQ